MTSLLKLMLYVSAISSASCGVITKEEHSELILVSVIFRHGARTTYSFYPNDPNHGNDFYPIGLGGLTNEGKLGEYVLGRYLRNLYGDFLGDDYTENKVYVRSTDVTRTKMSAQLVLAGLFPPSEVQQWNPDLKWQPIPVEYKSETEEDLFHPWGPCPYKAKLIEDLPNIEEVQEKFINPYLDTFNFIHEKSGKNISNPADMQDFFLILKTESDMGLIMPNWTHKIFPEPTQSIAGQAYTYHNYNQDVKQINAGYLLAKILNDSLKKINGSLNPSERMIFLYSGHESTLGYMLSALNVYEPHVPPYGSAISFEVYRIGDEHYFKLKYRNDTDANEPEDLTIPGCTVMCPLSKFVELNQDLIPSMTIRDACRQRQ